MDNIQLLISEYLDGELTDDEIAQLADRLRTDEDVVHRLVLGGFVHWHLIDWQNQQRVQDGAMTGTAMANHAMHLRLRPSESLLSVDPSLCDCPEFDEAPEPAAVRRWIWPPSIATRAASVLVAACLLLAAYTYVTRPTTVAQLTEAAGCQWEAAQANTLVGALLESGRELKLVKGRALITLVSGAQLLLEGPTSLRLDSDSLIELRYGQIAAKVPTQAIGFTVSTSLARFVDLGTEFSLKIDADTTFDLYVFEGLVELQLDERFGEAKRQPLRVAEVRAVHFDVKSGDVESLSFPDGKQMPF